MWQGVLRVEQKERDKMTAMELEKRQIKAMAKAQLRFDNDWYKASNMYLIACDKAERKYKEGLAKLAGKKGNHEWNY